MELFFLLHLDTKLTILSCGSYPKDVYDRIWEPYFLLESTQITTTLNVTDSSNGYAPPRDAITTAAIPTNASEPLTIIWSLETSDDETYGYLYFAEIQQLRANETREFKIVANGRVDYDSYSPMNFEADTVFNHASFKCEGAVCRLQLFRTPKSSLPPQMNAMWRFLAPYIFHNQRQVKMMLLPSKTSNLLII